ncbi:MAG: FmdB family transcriptional regulator [Rhodospirillaceae bacterium]|nr:FmdB family transcriptional regulator [Rhodospirillaceae bacterium]
MPIYEYRCESCAHELEALQKISDQPLRDCPNCQTLALRRLISAPSFRLKGDGWYETDFKSDKETKRNLVDSGATGTKDDQKSKSTDSDKDSKKSDSKSKDTKSSDSSVKKDSNAESK